MIYLIIGSSIIKTANKMLRYGKFIITLCDFLSEKEKVTLLTCNHELHEYLRKISFTELIKISEIIHLPYYHSFTNVLFDIDVIVLPKNIMYGTYRYTRKPAVRGTLHTKLPYYPTNITYVNYEGDNDEKKTVNFIKPARKTKFDDINNIRCATYVGPKRGRFDTRYNAPDLIAKFYIAHDDLYRFRKMMSLGVISVDDNELLLHVCLMRPVPPTMFSYILNHKTSNASASSFIEYLMCVTELGMPLDVRKIIVGKHAEMFWIRIYDEVS